VLIFAARKIICQEKMMQLAQEFSYNDQELQCEGYLAYNDDNKNKKPVILIAHDWTGRTEFNNKKAEKFAAMGYIGFAIDMYGHGKNGKDNTEKKSLMDPLVSDRKLLLQRILAAVQAVSQLEIADTNKIAAIGFCFGGLCVLDLARGWQDLAGAVALHANLSSPTPAQKSNISAKILALHGHDDPLVPTSQIRDFEKEMTDAGCDWQLNIYGGAMHAFTNPLADDPGFGTVYNKLADQRSWLATKNFLTELF